MRVSAICIKNYYSTNKNLKHANHSKKASNAVNFKGIEAGAKSLIGTALGIGIGTILTGGVAPLVLGIIGCTVGGIKGSKDEIKSGKYDDDNYDVSYYV